MIPHMYQARHGLDAAAVELLGAGRYAVLGTENPDGSVHLVPAMYLFADGQVLIQTSAASRKARNVRDRSWATVLVQDHRVNGEAWVSGRGPATVLLGNEAQQVGRRIRGRYLTEQGEEQLGAVMAIYDDASIVVTPERWMAWDLTAWNATLAEHGLPLDEADHWFLPV